MTGGFEGEGGAAAGNPNRPPDDPRELRDAFAGECCLLGCSPCSRFLVPDVLGADRRVDEFGCSDRAFDLIVHKYSYKAAWNLVFFSFSFFFTFP